MKIVLDLTETQADFLEETLFYTQDEGPTGEGWASDQLLEIREKVELAIRKAKTNQLEVSK